MTLKLCKPFYHFVSGEGGGGGDNSHILEYRMCHFFRVLFGWKINFWVYFLACNKFFGSDCHEILNYMLMLLTHYKLCAIRMRHIIGTSEDVQYKQVNHQVLIQRSIIQKYFPVDKSLLLLIYQVKMASSQPMAGCKNQLNMKYHSKLLVSEIVTLKSLFALENLPL